MSDLTREELVFLNRVARAYQEIQLPDHNAIRYEVTRLIAIVLRLEKKLDELTRGGNNHV